MEEERREEAMKRGSEGNLIKGIYRIPSTEINSLLIPPLVVVGNSTADNREISPKDESS